MFGGIARVKPKHRGTGQLSHNHYQDTFTSVGIVLVIDISTLKERKRERKIIDNIIYVDVESSTDVKAELYLPHTKLFLIRWCLLCPPEVVGRHTSPTKSESLRKVRSLASLPCHLATSVAFPLYQEALIYRPCLASECLYGSRQPSEAAQRILSGYDLPSDDMRFIPLLLSTLLVQGSNAFLSPRILFVQRSIRWARTKNMKNLALFDNTDVAPPLR